MTSQTKMPQTDCDRCTIEQDLYIRLCPVHKAAPTLLEACTLAFERLAPKEGVKKHSISM